MDPHRRERGAPSRSHESHEIHVGWLNDRRAWEVTYAGQTLASGSFRRRAYAIAFARAIAASRDMAMVVRDVNGDVTRHAPGTLSYPTKLD